MLILLLKWQPPLKRLSWGVPSCPDRGIFPSIHPRISMSHLSMTPFTLPQWGIRAAQTLIQLLNVLMTLWPLIDSSHNFNSPCCKDSHLPVTACKRTDTHSITYLSWLKLRSSLLAKWPYVLARKSGMSLQSCPIKEIFKREKVKSLKRAQEHNSKVKFYTRIIKTCN